jgi:CheY-like chemotaxis protein
MNGEITVKSKLEKGSEFIVTLNGVKIPEILVPDFVKQDISYEKLNSLKIILAEDIQINRELIKIYLENEDVQIYEAETGIAVLNMLKQFRPDIIIMDIRMPLMNGIDANQIIKNTPELKNIPVVAITAHATKEEVEQYKILFDYYLTKPVSKESLIETLLQIQNSHKN